MISPLEASVVRTQVQFYLTEWNPKSKHTDEDLTWLEQIWREQIWREQTWRERTWLGMTRLDSLTSRMKSKGAITSDANEANKLWYSRVVGHLNILSLLASFACEIHFIRAWNSLHNRCKFASCEGLLPGISSVVAKWLFVITSLLEQAPDWLTRREYPPKLRFFDSCESHVKRPKHSIRAV